MSDKIMPKHIAYHRDNFMGSARVNRRLDWLQRHIYRQLCLEACFCETRPYLPTDDDALALLADVPDDVWLHNRAAVLAMFTKSDDGYTHPRILSEWERVSRAFEQRRDAAKRGGAANAKRVEESRSASARLPNASHTDPDPDPETDHDPEHHQSIDDIDANDEVTTKGSLSSLSAAATANNAGTAVELVGILHTFLSQRKDVTVSANYKELWITDFDTMLLTYSYDEVRRAVIYSQLPRNQKYYIRAAGVLKSIDKLVEQSSDSTLDTPLAVLWQQASQGRLPACKTEKPPQGGYRGVKAAMDAQEKKQAFEIEEDLG